MMEQWKVEISEEEKKKKNGLSKYLVHLFLVGVLATGAIGCSNNDEDCTKQEIADGECNDDDGDGKYKKGVGGSSGGSSS